MEIITENKKAYHKYQVLERFEAGMVLIGTEVKSIKSGRISLAGSYVIIRNEEAFLIGAKIPPYQPKNAPSDYNPQRDRKLLLNKKEIKYLIGKTKERGLTLVPLKIYVKNAKIKLEIGIVRSKSKKDKREIIKKREAEREIQRELKSWG